MLVNKKNPGLRSKLFLYLMGFCALILTMLWLFQTVFLDSFYKNIKQRQIEAEANKLAAYIAADDWNSLMDDVIHRGDVYVEVLSDEGKRTVPGNIPEGVPVSLSSDEIQSLLAKTRESGGSLTTISDRKAFSPVNPRDKRGESERIYCTKIIAMRDGSEQLLILSSDLSPVSATVETLVVQLKYISAIVIFLAAMIALIISRWLSRPIDRLNSAARELGKGQYDVDFPSGGYREAAELSETLKQAAHELSITDNLRKELIANVSHDLRTPLTLITGYSEMMRDIPGENTPENMQVVVDEARRLTSLVKSLLDLSQLQSGSSGFEMSAVNITAETQGIIGRFAKLCEPEGIKVQFVHDRDAIVNADLLRISQVIYNFLTNAMTHIGSDKLITVRQICEHGRVLIQVIDCGEGIAKEDIRNVWERYYKVDKFHRRAAEGSGLGLSIVKTILERHEGVEYGVDSAEGEGSTFWFSLEEVAGE